MGKLVCIDSSNRFYIPADAIISVETKKTDDSSDPNNRNVVITYMGAEKPETYTLEMREYSVDNYCKSLQQHVNALL